MHILSIAQQPAVAQCERDGYFYLSVWFLREVTYDLFDRSMAQWPVQERDELRQKYREATAKLVGHLKRAEDQGQSVFIKEHCAWVMNPVAHQRLLFGHAKADDSVGDEEAFEDWNADVSSITTSNICSAGNETIYPDTFLRTLSPSFLIRHPALAFPSFLRSQILRGRRPALNPPVRLGSVEQTLHWSRRLYDWYTTDKATQAEQHASGPAFPIVLDADDIMLRPQYLLAYSDLVGLDTTKVRFTWAMPAEEDLSAIKAGERAMKATLYASTGIIEAKSAVGLDIEAEAIKWRDEFGERAGRELESQVRAALPDYHYLWSRRMHPDAQ